MSKQNDFFPIEKTKITQIEWLFKMISFPQKKKKWHNYVSFYSLGF